MFNKNISAIYIGKKAVSAAFLGARKIWSKLKSCFSPGWNNSLEWNNNDGWK